MNKKISYNLLAKYFVGQTSEEESDDVRKWRMQSSDNENLYQEYLHEWEIIHADRLKVVVPNADKVWKDILSRISGTAKMDLSMQKALYRAVAFAASFALVIGLSFSLIYDTQKDDLPAEAVLVVPTGQKSQLQLPDGTQIWLNADSKLTFSADYSKKRRIVQLEGEAYFDVVHDEDNKFVVKTSTVDVVVHGTRFSVTDYPSDTIVSVALDMGSVSVEMAAGNGFLTRLMPGQKVQISKSDISWNVSDFDAEIYNIWMLDKLQFKGESIYDAFRRIERWYGVKISLENEDPSYSYWFTLKTESLTEMLNLIDQITPIDYKINGEEVIIRYK